MFKKAQHFLCTDYMFILLQSQCTIASLYRLSMMLDILPTLAFETENEVESWTHLNKFRAVVSVLNASFDFFIFFLVLFPPEKWSSVQSTDFLIKEIWSGLLFSWRKHSDMNYFIKRRRWLMIRQTQSTQSNTWWIFKKKLLFFIYESSYI